MKKVLSFLIILGFSVLFTGCGKVDESISGVYTNGDEYSILLYTSDNEIASIAVKQIGDNFTFYPVEYPNYLKISGNELVAKTGEKIRIVKDGLNIHLTIESEEKGVWTNIEGTYTKVKNASSFGIDKF